MQWVKAKGWNDSKKVDQYKIFFFQAAPDFHPSYEKPISMKGVGWRLPEIGWPLSWNPFQGSSVGLMLASTPF